MMMMKSEWWWWSQSHDDEVSIVIDQDLTNPLTETSLASLDVIKNNNKLYDEQTTPGSIIVLQNMVIFAKFVKFL